MGALLAVIVTPAGVGAQRVQFPDPNLAPVPGPATYGTPGQGAYLGGTIQPFDPYSLPSNMPPMTGFAPYTGPPGWPGPAPPPLPGGPSPTMGAANVPPTLPPLGQPYGTPLPTAPGLPGAPTPSPYYSGSPYATQPLASTTPGPYQGLFQDTGLTATYLFGSDADDLALTDVEAKTTAYFANFFGISNGLRVTPGFIFHWTDGPAASRAHLPARLYSTYLDFALQPQFNNYFSAELNASFGVYSDFQAFNDDSVRFLGNAIGVWQMNPTSALKLGVSYLDRLEVKLLPAFGVLWTPNPKTKWDIFFPSPKFANYWTTMGNKEVWWYLGGEYGGGSWSIEREGPLNTGIDDRVDINDIRIFIGIESNGGNRVSGFAEIGYVFEREVVYYLVPADTSEVSDTFMVRGGVSW